MAEVSPATVRLNRVAYLLKVIRGTCLLNTSRQQYPDMTVHRERWPLRAADGRVRKVHQDERAHTNPLH